MRKKPDRFVVMLNNQAKKTVEGLSVLNEYLAEKDSGKAKLLSNIEKEADEMRRILVEDLMKTFVTPFDREDIFALSREIDDILDYANSTVDEMEILNVGSTPHMQQMASLLNDAAKEIQLAVDRLEDVHFSVASNHAQRAKALENRVETVYREALADLFKDAADMQSVLKILKVREIYRHLSNAADMEDQAANVIADIIMKIN